MPDNVAYTPGQGATVAADDIAGILYQRAKIVLGADGVNDGDVSSANPMPVKFSTAQAVTVAALPLPAGAATDTLQGTGNALLTAINVAIAALATEASLDALGAAQGASGSSAVGPMVQGLVSELDPAHDDDTVRPLSLTTDGYLRVVMPESFTAALFFSDDAIRDWNEDITFIQSPWEGAF